MYKITKINLNMYPFSIYDSNRFIITSYHYLTAYITVIKRLKVYYICAKYCLVSFILRPNDDTYILK